MYISEKIQSSFAVRTPDLNNGSILNVVLQSLILLQKTAAWKWGLLLALLYNSCQKPPLTHHRALRLANGAEPQSIDPHRCTGVPGIRIIGALFEGLTVRGTGDNSVRPGLAKNWEISPNGSNYTFFLRKSRWSDGRTLIAHDITTSWRRLASPSTGAQYASFLELIKNGPQVISGKFPPESLAVQAVNDSTLLVTLQRPTEYFLQLCAFEPLFPVPWEIISKYGEKWTSPQNIVSNGPYCLKDWRPNEKMVLETNPFYWDSASVSLKRLEFLPVDHGETAYKMFQNGEIDWIFDVPISKIQAVANLPEYFNLPQYGVYYYALNINKPPLNNKLVRQALSYALDREKIVNFVTKGGESSATGFVPVHEKIPYQGTGLNLYQPDSARMLLKKAGFEKGKGLPIIPILYNTNEDHKKIAEVVSQMWKKELGVITELLNYEWKIFLQSTRNLEHTVARMAWIADYADPYSFLELALSSNRNNKTGYANKKYDDCLEKGQKTMNPKARFKQLLQCEKILMQDAPVIPIYFYALNELRRQSIRGALPNPLGLYTWKDIYLSGNH